MSTKEKWLKVSRVFFDVLSTGLVIVFAAMLAFTGHWCWMLRQEILAMLLRILPALLIVAGLLGCMVPAFVLAAALDKLFDDLEKRRAMSHFANVVMSATGCAVAMVGIWLPLMAGWQWILHLIGLPMWWYP